MKPGPTREGKKIVTSGPGTTTYLKLFLFAQNQLNQLLFPELLYIILRRPYQRTDKFLNTCQGENFLRGKQKIVTV